MIEKIPAKPLLNKLRVMHVFEANFNLCLRILCGQRLMCQAESQKALGDPQFGSRKGKSSEEVVLYKVLTYELMRLTRTNGGTFNNDTKACYDRIIPSMTSVCAQRLGMKQVNVGLHARTLQQAKYRLKTSLGTSEMSYSDTKENPLYGLGQGSTAAAFAWAVISAVILQLMKLLQGIQFSNPTGTISVKRVMDTFVDDSTSWNNRFEESLQNRSRNYIRQIANDLSHTAQTWEKLLYSTGGALELSKCFYYLVHWIYDKRGDPTIAPPDPSIPPPSRLPTARQAKPSRSSNSTAQTPTKRLGY
jgi:hypothetical protein